MAQRRARGLDRWQRVRRGDVEAFARGAQAELLFVMAKLLTDADTAFVWWQEGRREARAFELDDDDARLALVAAFFRHVASDGLAVCTLWAAFDDDKEGDISGDSDGGGSASSDERVFE